MGSGSDYIQKSHGKGTVSTYWRKMKGWLPELYGEPIWGAEVFHGIREWKKMLSHETPHLWVAGKRAIMKNIFREY